MFNQIENGNGNFWSVFIAAALFLFGCLALSWVLSSPNGRIAAESMKVVRIHTDYRLAVVIHFSADEKRNTEEQILATELLNDLRALGFSSLQSAEYHGVIPGVAPRDASACIIGRDDKERWIIECRPQNFKPPCIGRVVLPGLDFALLAMDKYLRCRDDAANTTKPEPRRTGLREA